MEMEEDMDVEIDTEPVFEVREVDLDYEFDAARFFDFTCEESPAEARQDELWFESAPTYPPSPFVKKLVLREESIPERVNTSTKCKEVEDSGILKERDSKNVIELEFSAIGATSRGIEGTNGGIFSNIQKVLQKALSQPSQLTAGGGRPVQSGLTTYNHMPSDKLKDKSKSVKPPFSRSSTLMKPTASQLAKKNSPILVASSRFQKQQPLNGDRGLCNSSADEGQAAKKQKLDGGFSRKVADVMQQPNFVHKAPTKEGIVDRNSIHNKLKLTTPKEPVLETAHRAQRIRAKNGTEQEHVTSVTRRFKARPLNRKILEAPTLPLPKKSIPKLTEFQEFRLKTSERALHLPSAVSTSSFQYKDADKGPEKPGTVSITSNGTREPRRPNAMEASSQDVCDIKFNYKARPLNKKIFSSKGDIGVFRNIKSEATVPVEFNFHTDKRFLQNPPVELFSKMSLTSELQPSNGSQMNMLHPTYISTKGSKENRSTSFQPQNEMRHLTKEKPHVFDGNINIQCGSDGCSIEVGNRLSIRRLDLRR